MKKLIIISLMILILPIVYSLYGGETYLYHFDKCTQLNINITGAQLIDNNEYTLYNNCTKLIDNQYVCNCNNNYYVNITFNKGAINNYTIIFNYQYDEVVSSSSGGSGSHRVKQNQIIIIPKNISKVIVKPKINNTINNEIVITNITQILPIDDIQINETQINESVQTEILPITKFKIAPVLLTILIVLAIIVFIFWILFREK